MSVDLQATDGGKAERDLIAKKTDAELKAALKATNAARAENKKGDLGPSEKAKNERVLKEGALELRKQMKTRGLDDSFIKAKTRPKARGGY